MAAFSNTDKLPLTTPRVEQATQSQSSFEIKRTAKGEPTITVKVYVEDDTEEMQRKIHRAMFSAIMVFYGAEAKIAELEAMTDTYARALDAGAVDAVSAPNGSPLLQADELAVIVPVPERLLEDSDYNINGDEAVPDFTPPGKAEKPKRRKKILPPKPTLEEAMAAPEEDDDEFGEE